MKTRWKALASAVAAAALVAAPLLAPAAVAEEDTPIVGVIGGVLPWLEDMNHESYWEGGEHQADCYKHSGDSAHGTITDDGKTVTLATFDQAWPGDHWELLVIKGGSNSVNVITHPEAGVAYASPLNDGGQQSTVSHWTVCKGTTPEEPDPVLIVPGDPVPKDKCGTENDHYGLPPELAGIGYTRDGLAIVATITAANTIWGALPAGWVKVDELTARYDLNPQHFTNEPCHEEPVQVTPQLSYSAPTCFAAGSLNYDLNQLGIEWTVVDNGDGTRTITATATGGYLIPEGTTRSWTIPVSLEPLSGEVCEPEDEPIQLADPTIYEECGTEEDGGDLPTDVGGVVDYEWVDDDPNNLDIFAHVAAGYVVTDSPNWSVAGEGLYVFDWTYQFDDEPCPTPPPGKPPVVSPNSPPLAATGSGDISPMLWGGIATLLLGAAALVWRRVASR